MQVGRCVEFWYTMMLSSPGMHTVEVPVLVTRSSLGREDQNWGMTTKMKNSDLVIANAIYGSSEVLSVCQIMNISDLPKR